MLQVGQLSCRVCIKHRRRELTQIHLDEPVSRETNIVRHINRLATDRQDGARMMSKLLKVALAVILTAAYSRTICCSESLIAMRSFANEAM